MRKIIRHFRQKRRAAETVIQSYQTPPPSPSHSHRAQQKNTQQQWQPMGHIYYLLDTLKLCYQSKAGLVTYERISPASLMALCEELLDGKLTQPQEMHQLSSLFTLSVCGVSWEELGHQTRVKAIPEAAAMRFSSMESRQTEARFQLANRRSDDAITSITELGALTNSLQIVHNLSVEQFIAMLEKANNGVPATLSKAIPIKADNFAQALTQSDKKALAQTIKTIESRYLYT
ncbi:hypothetical protein [Thaumasiovibrio subtropicus]|uniref:hypothetical protein n=1 Tax=Thaumasiovibrio subtropicus TaxID=1891207 RepID=UPI000B355F68|nr:hypothetical protein [Thaumasiovibrio subtropicus]